jgi:hypothetical protein
VNLRTELVLTVLIFLAALLYSSVGHAGASGYLAAMGLLDVAPPVMKPTALALNVLVAAIATTKFYRARYFCWRTFWPFAVASVPCAFLGGVWALPVVTYTRLVAAVLVFAALRLFVSQPPSAPSWEPRPAPIGAALVLGAGIGLLAGLTGVGGGIFLSPLLLLVGWADARRTAGVSAAFILVNSAAGLAGHLGALRSLPPFTPLWAVAAAVGGWIGAGYGSRKLGNLALRRLLAIVLVIASIKMVLF